MEIKRMLEVVQLRFAPWNPSVSTFGEEGFRVEFDNYNRTGRVLLRGKVKFESAELDKKFKWDISGNVFEQDKARIVEIQKVVAVALV